MLKSGVSLKKAFETIILNTKNKYFNKILNNIYIDLLNGNSLSDALNNYPHVFKTIYINTISIGLRSGKLSDSFLKIAKWLENEAKMKTKIKQSTTYPKFLLRLCVFSIT